MFDRKAAAPVGGKKGSVHPFHELREELFQPEHQVNINSNPITCELGLNAATALLDELRDTHKATARHLSSIGGECSWQAHH